MNIAKLAGAGVLAYTLAVACGGISGQAGGSNTNWFETCASTAECGKGFECWCGICTAACATDCSAPAGATCAEPPVTCGETKTACAVECRKDSDCSALGAGASCVNSICRKRASASEGGSKLTCNERITAIGMRISALQEQVDLSCTTTADCVSAPDVRCHEGCGALASKAGAAAIASQVTAVEKELCDPFEAAGCFYPAPPCLFPGNPACIAGRCGYFLPGAPDSGAPTCDALGNQVVDRLNAAADAADVSCAKDSDCTRSGPGASCLPECLYKPVSNSGAATIAAERNRVEGDLCARLDAQGCDPLIYTCPSVPAEAPVCVNGTCQNASSDAGSTNCADRTASMRSEIERVAPMSDKTCRSSSDCSASMLVNQCYESCTYVPVSSAGAVQIDNLLAMMEAAACPSFTSAGCKVTRLPCVAPPPVICQNGQCDLLR